MKTTMRLFFIVLAIVSVTVSPQTEAFSPPPDGAYPAGNTAEGQNALFNLTTGGYNAAIGWLSLRDLSTGSFNTAVGAGTLALNNGDQNTAIGVGALLRNTTASQNTAQGAFALFSNTVGDVNTAVGNSALLFNTGDANTAIGLSALIANTTGVGNTAVGDSALDGNTTGSANTALGADAGVGVTTANGVICIGHGVAGADVSNTTWIGNIYGVATQSGTTAPVVVSDTGQLGTVASSERFKKDISGMARASDAILLLRPVTFHYKTDTKDTPQFGLIAEEVAKVNPALVLPDKEGKPYTVRYDAVNAMLLNEFLKEHCKVMELETTVVQQREEFESKITHQQKQIEALTAGLQKVSAQVEASKPAPQVVENSR